MHVSYRQMSNEDLTAILNQGKEAMVRAMIAEDLVSEENGRKAIE